MLRVVQQNSSAAAKNYYSRSDYLSEGQELVGNWGGKGAQLLGLGGQATKREFDALCDNLNPGTGERLTARSKQQRTCGYDFTWSVPKSVSLLYGLTEDQDLLNAFRDSVDETMRDIEAEMKTRVRIKGQDDERVTGNATWATFYHFTSRPVDAIPDPQMHAHCFMFNNTFDQTEQRWKAGQFRDLKKDAPYWQAAFRARLANRLQEAGYRIERKKDDFDIAGVSKDILKRFSRRTTKIEKLAQAKGIVDPEAKAKLGKSTREHKNATLSWNHLRTEWRTRLSDNEWATIETICLDRTGPVVSERQEKLAVNHALDHCFVRDSVVTDRELETEALRRGVGGVSVEGIRQEFAERELFVREVDGKTLVTTPAVRADEKEVADFARNGRGKCEMLVGMERTFTRNWMSGEQKAAVRHLWESPDRVILIKGAAGTGKTTMLQEAVEAFTDGGIPFVALAQTATASRGVLRQEAKIADANTIARFLKDERMQENARGGVIVVDEVSQIGVRSMVEITRKAISLDARLVIMGDPKQMQAVERGSVFQLLADEAALPIVELSDVRRQKDVPAYKLAVEAMSNGRMGEGFDALNKMGWVHEIKDGDREKVLATEYLNAVSERKNRNEFKSAIVVAPSHAEADRITDAIRSAMQAKGQLGEERVFGVWTPTHFTESQRRDAANYEAGEMIQLNQHIPGAKSGSRLIVEEGMKLPVEYADRFQVYRPTTLAIAAGDQLMVTAGGKTKNGKRLENGDLITVKGFNKEGDIVDTKGRVIDKEFGHLRSGFAVTAFASQGRTVDIVLISQSAASGRAASAQQFYVSVSRGREKALVFVDSIDAVRESILAERPRMSATELMRKPKSRLHRHLGFRSRLHATERHDEKQPSPEKARVLHKEATYGRE